MSEQQDPNKQEVHPLDEELRRAFKNLVEQKLPDRFDSLLEQLRRGELPKERPAGDRSEGPEIKG